MTPSTSNPILVFYSYSHKDEKYRQRLENNLALLRRQGLIKEWHDRQIGAGQEWQEAIDTNLEAADVILLLVSADFLASDYCYSVEMTRALDKHEAGKGRVIPIILHPADWKMAQFSKLQAVPTDGKPITGKGWHTQNEAWLDVATGIRKVIQEVRTGRLLDKAIEKRGQAPQLTANSRSAVLKRARRVAPVLQGAQILWVDDNPGNNVAERQLLRHLDIFVDLARSTDEAKSMLKETPYDVIISDMKRGGDGQAGLELLSTMRKDAIIPTIFYLTDFDRSKGIPVDAFGITNRPDELIHYVMDILERERS
jgi:CheY-like chemotaxis protein